MTPNRPAVLKLIKYARDNAEFTCDPEKNVYTTLTIGDRRETLPLGSRSFTDYLINTLGRSYSL